MNNYEHAARLTELTDMGATELARRLVELEERESALAAHLAQWNDWMNSLALYYDPDMQAWENKGWDLRSSDSVGVLASRDLIKQAEALEHRADCIMAEAGYLENFRREVAGILRNDAKDKRQQAAAL